MVLIRVLTCLGLFPSLEDFERFIPSFFRPYDLLVTPRSRGLRKARIVRFANQLSGRFDITDIRQLSLTPFQAAYPRITQISDFLISKASDFLHLLHLSYYEPDLSVYSPILGPDLAVYGSVIVKTQDASDAIWLMHGLLHGPSPLESENAVWELFLKALVLARLPDNFRARFERVCQLKVNPTFATLFRASPATHPHLARWREVCNTGDLTTLMLHPEISATELELVLVGPRNFIVKEFFLSPILPESEEWKISQIDHSVSAEVDPLRKFSCVVLKAAGSCDKLTGKFVKLRDRLPDFTERIEVLKTVNWSPYENRWMGNIYWEEDDGQFPFIGYDLINPEMGDSRARLLRFISSMERFPMFPTLPRLLKASEVSPQAVVTEINWITNRLIKEVIRFVLDYAKKNTVITKFEAVVDEVFMNMDMEKASKAFWVWKKIAVRPYTDANWNASEMQLHKLHVDVEAAHKNLISEVFGDTIQRMEASLLVEFPDAQNCYVCLQNSKEFMRLCEDVRHAVCRDCARVYSSPTCGICRKPVTRQNV